MEARAIEKFVDIPGYRLAMKLWGPDFGLPVLAVHGWLDNAASYDYLAPLLPEWRLIAVDSPGCGRSSHLPVGAVPSVLDEVFHLFALADTMGWDRFHLLGHSRGAIVCSYMAAAAPERIASLGLIDAVGSLVRSPDENIRELRNSVRSFQAIEPTQRTVYPDLETAAKMRAGRGELSLHAARALTARGTEEVPGGIAWSFDRRLLMFITPFYPLEDQVRSLMRHIDVPTRIVLPRGGLYYGRPATDERIACLPNARVEVVDGGHHVHMDSPAAVAEALLKA